MTRSTLKIEEFKLKQNETLSGKDLEEFALGMLKGANDPVWFTYNVLGYEFMYPWQENFLRTFYRHKYDPTALQMRDANICAGQRSGKTMLVSICGSYEFFDIARLPSPQKTFRLHSSQEIFITAMATSAQLAEDGIFANMRNSMEENEKINQWFDLNFKTDRIDYNAKHIHAQVLGSWINTAIGRTNKTVILDEMDYYEDNKNKSRRSGWEIHGRMSKSRDTLGDFGHMFNISSPKTTNGPILTLARRAIADIEEFGIEKVQAIGMIEPTWNLNPEPPFTFESLCKKYKDDLATMWRDYGCRPELAGGMFFPEGIDRSFDPLLQNLLDDDQEQPEVVACRALSIDPAVTNDRFGIACGYAIPRGPFIVDGVSYFKKRDGDPYIMPSDVREFIIEAVPRCNIKKFMFDAWMFPEINEMMAKKFGIIAEKHIVGYEDYDRWRSYQSKNAARPVRICYHKELKQEAEALIVTESGKGKKVDHQSGGYKDMCDCVANLLWYFNSYVIECTMIPMTGLRTI
jgi:hypothetical protein